MAEYIFRTRKGAVRIVPQRERWQIIYKDEGLGSYHTPEAAADDAAGGHVFTPSDGTDLGELGISSDIGDWERR